MNRTLNSTIIQGVIENKPLDQQLVDEQCRATKLSILISALELSAETLQLPEPSSAEAFNILLDQFSYQEFVHLPTKKCSSNTTTILGIDNAPPSHQFTYTEKKTIRSTVVELAMQRILQPAIDFMQQKRRQPAQFNVFEIQRNRQAILDAEQRRLRLQTDLLVAQERRCSLIKRAAQHRVGGRLGDDMELLLKRLTLNGEKVSLLKAMVEREFVYRTAHSAKALKEVEGYMDAALDAYKK